MYKNRQMSYKKWEFRDGALIVEKFIGVVSWKQIVEGDEETFSSLDENLYEFRILSDISEATFPDVNFQNIETLFEPIKKNLSKTIGTKTAIYTGENNFEDFQKAMAYAEFGSTLPISIVTFNFLDAAMSWLGLTKQEQMEVRKKLKAFAI